MVKLLQSSTPVFTAPMPSSISRLPLSNACGYQTRYTVYVQNRPPKKSTSVARKIHMPSVDVSRCCASVAKECRSACVWGKLLMTHLLHQRREVVWPGIHNRGDFKVLR